MVLSARGEEGGLEEPELKPLSVAYPLAVGYLARPILQLPCVCVGGCVWSVANRVPKLISKSRP